MAVEEPVSPHNKFVARLNFVKPSIPAETTTLTSGTVFALSGSNGDILAHSHHGFYAHDTRFLSVFQVRLDGRPLLNTGSAVFNDRLASFYCNTGGISLVRDRYVSDHLHEDIYLVNNAPAARKVRLELTFAADFADIFEVRRGQFQKVGDVRIEPREGQDIALVYRRGDFIRETWINFSAEPRIKGSTAVIEVALEPKVTWQTCLDISPVADGKNGQGPCVVSIQSPPFYARKREKVMVGVFEQVPVDAPLETVPELSTDNLELCQAYYRAVSDLRSLRLKQDDHYLLAAGLPWFMAIFGRDAIISALQTKLLGPELMLGTLRTLADLQANASDPFREAQPGKILHEARRGELSLFEHVPHSRYYGSVDATPLFLLLLWEAYHWTGDLALLQRYLPAAERALGWIETYGDPDKDGFVEYRRLTRKGLRNQGWKDSWDSVAFNDGALAQTPIALAEVQGYVYEARLRMAGIYGLLGDRERQARLGESARRLKQQFNEAFWMPEAGYYATALDARKRQVNSITSNPGHCLWSGIVDAEKAPAVVQRLMSPEMFSGWGVRTLSADMTRYHPLSYHNGSVWPHDNSIIAAGLARYGFTREAGRIAMAILEAASIFNANRLPELFAGYPRREYSFPVPYPAANAPQAWASGALIYLMETVLGVTPQDGRLTAVTEGETLFRLTGVPYRGKVWDLPGQRAAVS